MEDADRPIRISHFTVERELGRDALGFVFDAIDEQLERPVTLRLVRAGAHYGEPDVPRIRAGFLHAARRAALLNHPNLVTIYEFRPLTETDLVVMERVEGESLLDMTARGARWTVLDAARLLARVADALAVAHEAGLVHGRVGPQNIRIRPDGRIKVLDLGIPKVTDELAPAPTPRDDVVALARTACGLLAAAPAGAQDSLLASLRDPAMARARYGVLAPVLARAIEPPEQGGFANAAELRDALVLALEAATSRANPEQGGTDARWATRMVGPAGFGAEERLPTDARALHSAGHQPATGSRRIILPPDLAQRAHPGDESAVFELPPGALPAPPPPPAFARVLAERRLLFVAAGAVVILLGGWIGVRALLSDGSASEPDPATGAIANATPAPPPALPALTDTGAPPAFVPEDTLAAVPVAQTLRAMVRASPPGTVIQLADRPDSAWTDAVELSVPAGESLALTFSRPGYVSQSQTFEGTRLSVTLVPDSVVATFRANVPADVFLVEGTREQRLGRTNFERALPTGTHRIVFRSPGQDDWTTQQAMAGAGRRYTVEKDDYVTRGDFVGTVAGTWARVSVDGGPERDTPARFDDLTVGPHVVRVTREGFRTIVDTVVVRPGQLVTRQYTLVRSN